MTTYQSSVAILTDDARQDCRVEFGIWMGWRKSERYRRGPKKRLAVIGKERASYEVRGHHAGAAVTCFLGTASGST